MEMKSRAAAVTRGSLVLISALVALPVAAAEKSWTLAGGSLEVSTPCARQVDIVPASSAREISVSAIADHQEEIDALLVTGGGDRVTVTKQGERCPFSRSRKQETMRLTITMPAGGDLSVREGGSGDYRVTVPVDRLDLRLSGSGGLKADRVAGPLDASLSGSGGADVREMAGKSASVHISGSADVKIGGTIGSLEIDLSGSGGVAVAAAGAADLETSGSGSIRADSMDGALSFEASGSGGLKVGSIQAPSVKIRTSGDGGVSINNGRIGSLQVTSHGSADARIDASADRAELSTSGSGTIDVRQVSGTVSQKQTGSGRIRVHGS
ncbi:GIN domain-containing protein [Niveispirillum sp. KHB5.9]|uniref:GIN domain-containing protein n=1 Tax=Niveispirillum sp. KHB5.9 TaxID=3400269 RepID=UPI003A8B63FD